MIQVFFSAAFMPHGYCLLWQPWLVALHAGSDLLIFLAYTTIPIALVKLLKLRPELAEFRKLILLFAAFILLCGLSHLVGLITLWVGIYPLQGMIKAATALVSVTTAVVLFPLVPKIAALPGPAALASANRDLVDEIAAHKVTLAELRQMQADLEQKVEARTADLRASNERLNVLTHEMAHRSKNLLTVVQSIWRQTAKTANDKDELVTRMDGRIAALASATDSIVRGDNRSSADFGEMVQRQLSHYIESYPERLKLSGDAIEIRADAAQQLALIMHELATNAVKYGALSGNDGSIHATWDIDREQDRLTFRWEEVGIPSASEALEQDGFGTRLLLRAAPIQLGGNATRNIEGDRLRYVLTVPLDALAPDEWSLDSEKTMEAYG